MNLSPLLALLREMPIYTQLVQELSTTEDEHKVAILDTAKAFLMAALYEELGSPFTAVNAQRETARKFRERTTRPTLFFDRRLMRNFAVRYTIALTQPPEF